MNPTPAQYLTMAASFTLSMVSCFMGLYLAFTGHLHQATYHLAIAGFSASMFLAVAYRVTKDGL